MPIWAWAESQAWAGCQQQALIAALFEERFAGRSVTDVETLNAQTNEWRHGIAADRRCPGQDAIGVREAFAEEAPRLLPLPDNPHPLIEQIAVKAGKTPYIRFDLNDYSIPHTRVRQWLTVLANPSSACASRRSLLGVPSVARAPAGAAAGNASDFVIQPSAPRPGTDP